PHRRYRSVHACHGRRSAHRPLTRYPAREPRTGRCLQYGRCRCVELRLGPRAGALMRAISQTSPASDFTPTPRRGVNVSHFLTQTARRLPEQLAVIDDDHGQRWTWAELDARAEALAAALQDGGVGRRDSVLLLSAN